jgi:hypothetical protein
MATTGAGSYNMTDVATAKAVTGFETCASTARNLMRKLEDVVTQGAARMAGDHVIALNQLHMALQQDQANIEAALQQLGESIGRANTTYTNTSQQQAGDIGKLRGLLTA